MHVKHDDDKDIQCNNDNAKQDTTMDNIVTPQYDNNIQQDVISP